MWRSLKGSGYLGAAVEDSALKLRCSAWIWLGQSWASPVDSANLRCWNALEVGGIQQPSGRSSPLWSEPLSLRMQSLPKLWGLAGKA